MDKIFDSFKPYAELAGRILIAALFVISGWGKISGYAGTQQYMAAMGVPGAILPLVIALELGGGLAIVLGLFTRPIALLLAGFSIVAAVLFHGAPDQVNQIMFLKNFAIAGGFLFLVANGAGKLSVDQLLRKS
ncbi:DoxX family protein [Solimonas variicoloris]|uniref:DoxX family protein n=1 Tax=Solimonas variicoloris TaxID=254408 RepID=UPI00035D8CD7|nr:DoxX family protein [Solimonas variicoloris]